MVAAERRGTGLGMAYALVCYLGFVASFTYFILFVTDVWVPTSINAVPSRAPGVSLCINLGLVVMWGLQHSIMARKRFKDVWTRLIPAHTERATYCLASSLALAAVCAGWSPIAGAVWNLDGTAAAAVHVIGVVGWVLVFAASFEVDHFELFGLKQAWRAMRGLDMPAPTFQQRFLYKFVRHPLQFGIFIGMWATPNMSYGHLLFAASMTSYILVGLYFEERDLVRQFGDTYRCYRSRVPQLIPWAGLRTRREASDGTLVDSPQEP